MPTCMSLPPQVVELPVTERQIEREHLIQLRRWQETRGELQSCSPPRLHGAKAILEAEPGPRPTLQPSPSIRLPLDAPLPGSKGKPKPSKQIDQVIDWCVALWLGEGCGDVGSNPASPLPSGLNLEMSHSISEPDSVTIKRN